ncbi:MAG: porin, partial [Gammaproteobacteria bacterium]
MMKIVAAAMVLVAASVPGITAHAADQDTISYLSKHTTLGVKIFSDLSYITNTSNGADVNPSGFGFDVKRGYLTLDTGFNDAWSIRFRTDFNYASAIGETNVYIKNLYAQRKFDNGIKLR